MKKLPTGKELEQLAEELGCDIQGDPITQSHSGRHPRASDYELQKRVIEAQRSRREQGLWILALLSAIAAIISALTAIIAVVSK
jgi:signal recognition particle subunit SEC65